MIFHIIYSILTSCDQTTMPNMVAKVNHERQTIAHKIFSIIFNRRLAETNCWTSVLIETKIYNTSNRCKTKNSKHCDVIMQFCGFSKSICGGFLMFFAAEPILVLKMIRNANAANLLVNLTKHLESRNGKKFVARR